MIDHLGSLFPESNVVWLVGFLRLCDYGKGHYQQTNIV